MKKFRFNPKTAANFPTPEEQSNFITDIDQVSAQRAQQPGVKNIKKRKRQQDRRRASLDKPYGILHGNPQAMLTGDPADRSQIVFYHSSLPEHKRNFDPTTGRLKVHQMREWLMSPGSGYRSYVLPVSSYAHDPEMVKLAPRGLTTFVRKENTSGKFRNTRSMRILERISDMDSETAKLREDTGGSPIVDELDPNDLRNIWEEFGPEETLSRIFTDRGKEKARKEPITPDLTSRARICTCGHSDEMHGEGKDIQDHKFTPQYIINEDGEAIPGTNVRASQSDLLRSYSTPSEYDDPTKTGPVLQRADRSTSKIYMRMPVVNVGLTGSRIVKRYSRRTGVDRYGRPIQSPVITPIEKEGGYMPCPGEPGKKCYNGRLNPSRATGMVECDCCTPGMPVFSSDGRRKIGVGIGGGKIKILNIEDCPDCPDCDNGYTVQNNKSEENKIRCRTCNATGKDLSAMQSMPCINCHSKDGTILLTQNNKCGVCGGSGTTGVKRLTIKPKPGKEKEPEEEVLAPETRIWEGCPIEFMDFDRRGWGESSIDGWKAHAAPGCKTCHGDDEYQNPTTNQPCDCRIGSFTDTDNIIAPRGARFVTPEGIKIPEKMFQDALIQHFAKDPLANPHRRVTDFDPEDQYQSLQRNRNFSTEQMGMELDDQGDQSIKIRNRRIPTQDFIGMYVNGISLPPSKMRWLVERSMQHRASKNAEFTAGSAELEDIKKVLTDHFAELPINIPGVRLVQPTAKARADGKIDTSTLHPRVQKASESIPTTALTDVLPPVLDVASKIEHARDAGVDETEHFDAYQSALSKLMTQVSRRLGPDKVEEFKSTLKGLPSMPEEETQNA